MVERLQKYIAYCGVASRRKSEEIILEGRVKVNGTIITELGYKIDSAIDKVFIDNELITPEEKKVYIALNKPVGVISSVKDEKGRKTIVDLINVEERIYPIGRLDYDTSGLILLTNDGEVYNKVIHPRKSVNKIYIAELKGVPDKNDIKKFCSGVDIGGYITAPAKFRLLKSSGSTCSAEIIIHEGKNRQIRKMCDAINHPVMKLKRVAVGDIKLEGLKLSEWRYLKAEEITYLKNL